MSFAYLSEKFQNIVSNVNVWISVTFHNDPKYPLILPTDFYGKQHIKKFGFSVPKHCLRTFLSVEKFGSKEHCS